VPHRRFNRHLIRKPRGLEFFERDPSTRLNVVPGHFPLFAVHALFQVLQDARAKRSLEPPDHPYDVQRVQLILRATAHLGSPWQIALELRYCALFYLTPPKPCQELQEPTRSTRDQPIRPVLGGISKT